MRVVHRGFDRLELAIVREATREDLLDMRSFIDPDRVRYVEREAHIRLIFAQLLGLGTTYAALNGVSGGALPGALGKLGSELKRAVRREPERAEKRLRDARERYRFL